MFAAMRQWEVSAFPDEVQNHDYANPSEWNTYIEGFSRTYVALILKSSASLVSKVIKSRMSNEGPREFYRGAVLFPY